jgi:hypothetical protein
MKEPTMEEVLELVEFRRNAFGKLYVNAVKVSVEGSVWGHVHGDVNGCIYGDVEGTVEGTISGRQWQFAETPKEKAIRLIREGKSEEAIITLEEFD